MMISSPKANKLLLTTPKQFAAKRILKALQPIVNGKQESVEEEGIWDMDLLMEDVKLVFEQPTPTQLAAKRLSNALQPLVDGQQEELEDKYWDMDSLFGDLKLLFELQLEEAKEQHTSRPHNNTRTQQKHQ